MKVFGLMLREDCSDRELREALARGSVRRAAREDQDLESMGSLLRCSSALRGNKSAGSLRSRHGSLDTRHGGIPRPAPPPCCAPVTPSAKERNLLYCVAAAAPAIPAQRAASAPMFLTPELPSPFDAALSSGASPSGGLVAINGAGAGPPARTRSGPAAPPPARAACAWPRRRRRAGAGARAGLPVVALFVLLAAGLALGVLVGQHLAGGGAGGGGGGGGGALLGASPSRLAAGLVAAVSAGGRAVHRRVLAGGGDPARPELGHAPADQPGAAQTLPPPARAAHVSLEGEAGLGARSAPVGGQPAGSAEQPGRAAGAGAAAGAAARGFWEGSRQTAEWRAATSERSEQRAADQDLQQQVVAEMARSEQAGGLETLAAGALPDAFAAGAALEDDGTAELARAAQQRAARAVHLDFGLMVTE